ncbi:hypothetical protein [Shewanella sp. SR43-8]|uniref:hypothetical protein n=1 Tax=Shewanella sp. SR43-8 TaxID=2760938 RepID=UPI001602A2D7|nr:hypothetical protein [Shewanella sp. SR43-8]MBB1321514.1 hypothetical protein [Shewanella sp. SR43-8]
MLIEIKSCEPKSYENEPDKMSALINLLATHGLRKNIIIAPKQVLLDVINSDLYSKNDKRYASDILESNRENNSLKKTLLMHGIVDFSSQNTSVIKNDNLYQISVGYYQFLNPKNAEATPIITENENDFLFYSVVGKYYSKYISKLNLNINLDHYLGAGSHSKTQFDKLSTKHPFLLCIVDNDKPHPKKGEGSTSSVFSKSDRTFNSGRIAKVIDIREIESIIPKFIIKEVFSKATATTIDALDDICTLADIENDFRRYFDHKDGLNLKKAIELDSKYGEFWLPILGAHSKFSDKDCFKTKLCSNCGQCPEVKGLGNSLLANSNNVIKTTNLYTIKRLLENSLKDAWYSIGEYVLCWGCVSTTRPSRS